MVKQGGPFFLIAMIGGYLLILWISFETIKDFYHEYTWVPVAAKVAKETSALTKHGVTYRATLEGKINGKNFSFYSYNSYSNSKLGNDTTVYYDGHNLETLIWDENRENTLFETSMFVATDVLVGLFFWGAYKYKRQEYLVKKDAKMRRTKGELSNGLIRIKIHSVI
jgi:hypothetical protein